MRLDLLLEAVEVLDLEGDPGVDVVDVTYSSSLARPGSLFCCLPGRQADGHEFALDAVANGAAALLVERSVAGVPATVTSARVRDARRSMGLVASALHNHPSRSLQVVGVTGTNGKSTTGELVRAILDHAGKPCGVLGTMYSARTTPESPDLQAVLASFVDNGRAAAAIEVSSVGLVQRRVDGVWFAAAVFTNLTPDELWIHGSVEDYFQAKAMLFEPDRAAVAVINVDDEWGARLARERESVMPVSHYSVRDAVDLDVQVGSSTFTWRGERVCLPLHGAYNVMNALGALTATAELGVAPAVAAVALSELTPIEGHGDFVECGQPFRVMVDYAHTAGALAAALAESRRAGDPGGRVIVVFGCGGDRDPGRRGAMGEAAAGNADIVVVTSDNPRTEHPLAIIEAIADGARAAQARDLRLVADRRAAIEVAIEEARAGDVVVIAGKGHEKGQEVGTEVLPFDDTTVVTEALRERGYGERAS